MASKTPSRSSATPKQAKARRTPGRSKRPLAAAAGVSSGARAPAAPSPLDRIRHVVVLMLENRSFDNLLGWLYADAPPPREQAFDGLTPDLWNPLDNIDSDGNPFVEKVLVRKNGHHQSDRGGAAKACEPDFCLPAPDPGEGYHATNHQLFGRYDVAATYPPPPTNMGFVNDYQAAMLNNTFTFGEAPCDPRLIMTCFTPEQVPVLSTLARQFAVSDRWYASVPSQTLPNRAFLHAATSDGFVNNPYRANFAAPTIFNAIQDAIDSGRKGLSWAIYASTRRGQYFSLTRTVTGPLQDRRFDPNFKTIAEFYQDAKNGALPTYAFIEPQMTHPPNDQHPPGDIRPGEQLIADVYKAVVRSKQWNETLLVITYDEHGGCYDHAAPPGDARPPDGEKPGQDGFLFNRFGVRVPTVIVSPWIEAGTVARAEGSTPYDHTTVVATVRGVAGLTKPLTAREAAAPDLGNLLTRSTPRADKPSVTPLPAAPTAESTRTPAGAQRSGRTKGPKDPQHDLHRLLVKLIEERLERKRRPDENFADFVHDGYASLFPGTSPKKASRR